MLSAEAAPICAADLLDRFAGWIVLVGSLHPTNGEPTPTATVFSKQVKEESIKMSQLPPAFAEDLSQWSAQARIPLC